MQLLVELYDDGGIRVTPPQAQPGMATVAAMLDWVDVAVARGYDVRIAGHVHSPAGRAVLELLPGGVTNLAVAESSPSPWHRHWTSLMWAAEHGLVAATDDLLARGSSPDSPGRAPSPYRLAMRRGHVPVMLALRTAGAEDPVLRRPPGAPDAVVMRPYLGWLFWWLAPIPAVAGVVAALVSQSVMWAIVGVVAGAAVGAIGLLAHVLAGRTTVAVDGAQLYSRRFWRWRGPVDLRSLAAIGMRESQHRRSPTLLRLANPDTGEPISRRTTHAGFDPAIVDRLRTEPEMRVLTIYLAWNYLRPGFERYVATFVDPRTTLVSTTVEPLVGAPRSAAGFDRS